MNLNLSKLGARGVICCAVALVTVLACVNQTGVPYDMRRWNRHFAPHRVIDNIYYVGTNEIAQFLVVTSAGLILLDTGFEASVPRLRENIESLGFSYENVRLILTTHAHIDHVQGQPWCESRPGSGGRLCPRRAVPRERRQGGTGL